MTGFAEAPDRHRSSVRREAFGRGAPSRCDFFRDGGQLRIGAPPRSRRPLAIMRQVSEHAAKLTARAMAQQRAQAVRDVARDCARLAERVERCRLHGADLVREAAARFEHIADNLDAALRTR